MLKKSWNDFMNMSVIDRVIFGLILVYCLTFIFSISISQIGIYGAVTLWILKGFVQKNFSENKFPCWYAFAAFAGAMLLSATFSYDPADSFYGSRILLNMLIFFMVVNQVKDHAEVELMLKALLFACFLAALLGIWQGISGGGASAVNRAKGTLSIFMTYAGLLMLVLLYFFPLLFGKGINRQNAILWFFQATVIVAILFTFTRNVWVGMLCGLTLLIFLKWKWKVLLLPCVVVAVLLVSPSNIQKRFVSIVNINDSTNSERIEMWKVGMRIFKEAPLTGVGHDTVQKVYHLYKDPDMRTHGNMHNIYMMYLVEYGIVGLAAWLYMIVTLLMHFSLRLRRTVEEREKAVLLGVLASMAGLLSAGMFESNFGDTEINMLVYFLFALPFVLERGERTAR